MTDQSLFQRAYVLKARLRAVQQAFGPLREREVLYIGPAPEALRSRLLTLGGDWTFTEERGELPYHDGRFDCVVLVNHLERVEDDYAFIADVHRVLKSAGLLYVEAEHAKRWTVWRPLRRLFAVEDFMADRVRLGYTEGGLFDLLKDGFDIQTTRTYARFFSEGVETVQRLAMGAFVGPAGAEDDEALGTDMQARVRSRLYWIQSVLYPFFVISTVLDWLLFFTKGYRLRAVARRRLWKPRRTPVLRDGRSLADATLNSRIGTAAPF